MPRKFLIPAYIGIGVMATLAVHACTNRYQPQFVTQDISAQNLSAPATASVDQSIWITGLVPPGGITASNYTLLSTESSTIYLIHRRTIDITKDTATVVNKESSWITATASFLATTPGTFSLENSTGSVIVSN